MKTNQMKKASPHQSSKKRPMLDDIETILENMEVVQKKQDRIFQASIVFSLMLAVLSVIGLLLVQSQV